MNRVKILLAQNGIFVALVALIIFFTALNGRFLSLNNAQTVLLQVVEIGIIALPLAFLVMSGSLDLSIGSVASLSGVVAAMTMVATGSTPLGILIGVLCGVITGAINGLLVAYVGLNPLVVTLGFLSVWGGLALYLTNGTTIAGLPDDFRSLGTLSLGPIPWQILLLVAAFVGAAIVLNRLPFGRNVLAIGGNARAAYLMGVRVRTSRFLLFVVTGVCASIAGILLAAKLQSAGPSAGSGMEIQALTVVLLGGIAFEGGAGRITGVLAGLLFVGVLRNGLVIIGVSQFLQMILIGATLVTAVLLDGAIQRVVRSSWRKVGVKAAESAAPTVGA